MTPPIAIVGAGPSGLMLARLLNISDVDFIIFDRDCSGNYEGQGGSLDIHSTSGQAALKEAGLFDNFQRVARYEDQSIRILDNYGNEILLRESEGREDRPEIDRKELRALLLDSIPSGKLRWNSRVQSVTRNSNGLMALHFANGNVETGFKLIIGADGAWSKVRGLITSATPRYSGLCYVQTCISPDNPIHPMIQNQVGRGTCLALGEGKQVVTQRMGNGSYNVYAGLPLPEDWSHDCADAEELNERCHALLEVEFSNWTSEVTKWFQKGDGKYHIWFLNAMPVESLSWKSVPGITVIGDAAHVSTPFVGEGVNCAMHDSLELARAIVKFGMKSLDEAVAEYEEQMFQRGIDLITRSKENGDKMFAVDAAQHFKAMFSESNEI